MTSPESKKKDFTIRKEILWESDTENLSKVNAKEVELIRELHSNNQEIGYNLWSNFKK